MNTRIREILSQYGRLSVGVDDLSDDADLYRAGLASHASVNVMLAIEDEFDIEFPEGMLRKQTFESINSIRRAIEELTTEASMP